MDKEGRKVGMTSDLSSRAMEEPHFTKGEAMVTSHPTPLRRGADDHGPISPLGREREYGCTDT